MKQCTVTGGISCCALPLPNCFGRSRDWKYTVDTTKPNWRRDLERHEQRHNRYEAQSEQLMKQSALMKLVEDAQWECDLCKEVVTTVGRAANHTCKPEKKKAAPCLKKAKKTKTQTDPATAMHDRPQAQVPPMSDLSYSQQAAAVA